MKTALGSDAETTVHSAGSMLRRLRTLALAVSTGATFAALAQEPPHEVFSVADGLVDRGILDLDQDSTGRLWILDRHGVTVYDGSRFESRSAGVVPAASLGALVVDGSDRPWVASGDRPDVFRLGADGWEQLPRTLGDVGSKGGRVFLGALLQGDRATIAAAGGDGLWVWTEGPQGFSSPARPAGTLPSDKITVIAPFGDELAVGTSAGLCFLSFSGELDCSLLRRLPALAGSIHTVCPETPEGGEPRLWIVADSEAGSPDADGAWLGRLQDGELTKVLEPPDLEPILLQSPTDPKSQTVMAIDPVGGMYFGTRWSLSYLSPDRQDGIEPLHLRRRLPSVGVNSILVDREGGVWLGGSRGLARITGRRFLHYDRDHGLVEDEVTAAVEPIPGTLVLGHNLGVTLIEGRELTPVPFELPSGLYRNEFRVLGMEVGPRGNVWLAASRAGLLRLDLESRRLSRELEAASRVLAVARDDTGRLWVAAEEGLFVGSDGDGEFEPIESPQGIRSARRMLMLGDGRMLITHDDGLLVRESDGRWSQVQAPAMEDQQMTALLLRRSGAVWVGGSDGVLAYRDGRLDPVGGALKDLKGRVFLLLEDPEGRVWIGTADGVRVWDGRRLRHLTVRHGLPGREVNRGAALVDARGRVWIGTDRGISRYQGIYDRPIPAPRLELTGVDSGGELLPLDRELRLEPRRHQLVFHFRAVTFSREEEVQILYRLEGLEENMQGPSEVEASQIRYTNLGPGTYRFRIRAGRVNGIWGEEKVSAPIVVPIPLWRTTGFRGSVLAAVAALVFGLGFLRVRAARTRAAELETINRKLRRAAEERELLIADLEARNIELDRFTFTVSHDLKGPLVNIRGFLGFLSQARETGRYDQMDEDIARIDAAASQMGQLLDDLLALAQVGRIVDLSEPVPLGPLIEEVLSLLETSLRERNIEVQVAPSLPQVQGDRLRLRAVFQNLIDNAAKFTLDPPRPRITIDAETVDGRARISVADNGRGIAAEHRELIFGLFKRLDRSVAGTGVGLALVQRIVEAHGGRVWVESEGIGRGSRFVVELPTGEGPDAVKPAGLGPSAR